MRFDTLEELRQQGLVKMTREELEEMKSEMAIVGLFTKTNLLFHPGLFSTHYMRGIISNSRTRSACYISIPLFARLNPRDKVQMKVAALALMHAWGWYRLYTDSVEDGDSAGDISDKITPYGFWMGIAVGDYNNDGNLDFFFTNVGDTLPLTETGGIRGKPDQGGIIKGQNITNKHLMLRNDGNYKFSNVSDEVGVAIDGFGWGAAMEDLNLNGHLDLIFAQNYIDFLHQQFLPGAVYMNDGKGKFNKEFKYKNKNYGHTPVLIDFNEDGVKDVMWVNMIGPVFDYINKNTDDNNIINIKLH